MKKSILKMLPFFAMGLFGNHDATELPQVQPYRGSTGAFAQGVYTPRQHTKQTYRSQQRAAIKRRRSKQ